MIVRKGVEAHWKGITSTDMTAAVEKAWILLSNPGTLWVRVTLIDWTSIKLLETSFNALRILFYILVDPADFFFFFSQNLEVSIELEQPSSQRVVKAPSACASHNYPRLSSGRMCRYMAQNLERERVQ